MVLAQGLRLTAVGAALGLLASAFATSMVKGYLLNVNAMDPVAFTGAVVVLLAVAALAAVVPARRAGPPIRWWCCEQNDRSPRRYNIPPR